MLNSNLLSYQAYTCDAEPRQQLHVMWVQLSEINLESIVHSLRCEPKPRTYVYWWKTNRLSSEFIFFVIDAMFTCRCNKHIIGFIFHYKQTLYVIGIECKGFFLQNMLDFVSINFMTRVYSFYNDVILVLEMQLLYFHINTTYWFDLLRIICWRNSQIAKLRTASLIAGNYRFVKIKIN